MVFHRIAPADTVGRWAVVPDGNAIAPVLLTVNELFAPGVIESIVKSKSIIRSFCNDL